MYKFLSMHLAVENLKQLIWVETMTVIIMVYCMASAIMIIPCLLPPSSVHHHLLLKSRAEVHGMSCVNMCRARGILFINGEQRFLSQDCHSAILMLLKYERPLSVLMKERSHEELAHTFLRGYVHFKTFILSSFWKDDVFHIFLFLFKCERFA